MPKKSARRCERGLRSFCYSAWPYQSRHRCLWWCLYWQSARFAPPLEVALGNEQRLQSQICFIVVQCSATLASAAATPTVARHLLSGKCKALIFLRIWSFCSHAPYILSGDNSGRFLQNRTEVAQNCRRTKYTEHASKKIRPSKRLELYIFQILGSAWRTTQQVRPGPGKGVVAQCHCYTWNPCIFAATRVTLWWAFPARDPQIKVTQKWLSGIDRKMTQKWLQSDSNPCPIWPDDRGTGPCKWTEEVLRRTSLVPLAFPCFVLCLVRVEAEGLLDYQGRAGDHFHCTVEPSSGHIRCWSKSFFWITTFGPFWVTFEPLSGRSQFLGGFGGL